MQESYIRKPNTVCIVCKKAIYRRPGVIAANKDKTFCSMKCYGLSNRIEIPCIVCGTLILSGQNKISCSRACANKHRVGIQYKIGRPKDKATTALYIKQELLRKRGAKCERCGYNKKEKILQVHHKNRNNKDNRRENLEIICPNCHCEEHYS